MEGNGREVQKGGDICIPMPAVQKTQIWSPGEDPLEKEMETHSSMLGWTIHGQRSLVGYNPWGHKESDTTEWLTHTHTRLIHVEVWQKTTKFCKAIILQLKKKFKKKHQSYGIASSHIQMWELDHKGDCALKNWCFEIVILRKTLESPLDSKGIKLVNPK